MKARVRERQSKREKEQERKKAKKRIIKRDRLFIDRLCVHERETPRVRNRSIDKVNEQLAERIKKRH